MWLPAFVTILTLDQWGNLPASIGLSAIGVLFLGLLGFAMHGERVFRRLK